MSRTGPVHHYEAFAYLLQTACRYWDRGDDHVARFSTEWDHVTCRSCIAKKPVSAKEQAERDKLVTLAGTSRER